MTIKINDSRPVPKGGRKIVTLSEAEEVGAFELARQWADRLSWPALDRTAADELAELACMSALDDLIPRGVCGDSARASKISL